MSTSPSSEHVKVPAVTMPSLVTMPIDKIVPYWRNPRVLSGETVNAIAESISRFGYQQPIVVDGENVIIIGHTRYAALRRLGVVEVPVLVSDHLSPDKVKQLRVIDNKAAEFSIWDFNLLQEELAALDSKLSEQFFFEISSSGSGDETIIDVMNEGPDPEFGDDDDDDDGTDTTVDFICPSCFHSWTREVTRASIMTGRIA